MDTRYEIPPRLRLNRQASSFAATVDDSHFHRTFNYEREVSDEGDDDGSTPRLGIAKMSVDSTFDEPLHFSSQAQAQSTPAPAMTGATPAERLRAVLSRASSLTPMAKTQNVPLERTPSAALLDSDAESDDFETPRHAANGVPATPHTQLSTTSSVTQSIAQESVRSIFANALRSPGNTPDRPRRPRRGSIDSSIVEESPIKWSMLKPSERVKRLSMSDDEKEKLRAATAVSEKSFKPSQAVTYDQLRQRLENSSITVETSKSRSVMRSDMSIDMEEATEVEQELFKDREVPMRSTTPPIPSNMTLGQSASQFPSQFLGSNLLTENSGMRRMIEEAQLETTDSEAPEPNHRDNGITAAETSSEQATARPALVRQRTLSRNGSVGSFGSSSSRPTSRQSMNDVDDVERKRERERGWNHPLGPYMERHRATSPLYSISQSGGLSRMRGVSLSSISSSESDANRLSPRTAANKHSNRHVVSPSSKYVGISSGRLPSNSPNQIRVRTVSQPVKPSSPGSLAISVNSDKTQKPLDRHRTDSLNAREGFRTSPVIARSHSSSGHGHSDSLRPNPSLSPSPRTLSRSSSQASLRQREGPVQHGQPQTRERNWNPTRPKWNTGGSPSIASERRRSGDASQLRTQPVENSSRPAPHGASSSPSGIPRLAVNGRTRTTSHPESGRRGDVNDQKLRDLNPLTNNPTSTSINGRVTLSIKDKNNGKSGGSKLEQKARSWRERGPRPVSPTTSPENNETEESEEDGTPKLGQQRIPDSPTPMSGSRPSSRLGTSPGFSSHDNKEGVIATLPTAISHAERERQRREGGQHRIAPPVRVSVPSEPIELRDSDLDSFQEEDIVASSSAPRLHGGDESFESDASSQAEEFPAGINTVRPRQDNQLNGHAEDVSRRRPVLPENFSPPLSPHAAHGDPVTLTPQRRTLANSSKLEFRTPSPPKGLPALPDPPSSEEDAGSDNTPPPAPVTPANRSRFADMKTPRLPGAWATPFATPAPAAATRANTAVRDSRAEKNQASAKDEIHTPPASYSRATSMLMKTPAPPGAWLATPGTVPAKRLQQRVRFDEQESSATPGPVPADNDGTLTSDISEVDGSVVMKATGKAKPTSPRTPGRIRVVDAFGNEISHSKEEARIDKRLVQKAGELHPTAQDEKSNSSEGRKARIRVLDAMGQEIDESQVHAAVPLSTEDESEKRHSKAENKSVMTPSQEIGETRLERKQAFQLLQKTIAQLKNDFDEAGDPTSAVAVATEGIDAQIADLKAQSIRAREACDRLLRKISDSTTGVSSRSKSAWNTLLYGRTTISSSSQGTHLRVFALLVLFQIVVFFAFYHLTSLGARQLFLTTYIDPFYPELYLHVTSPDHLHPSMPSHSNSGLTTSPSRWKYLLLESWHAVLDRILTLKEGVWDVWKDPPRGVPWPPT